MAPRPPAAPKQRSTCLRIVLFAVGGLGVLFCGFVTLVAIGSRLPATPTATPIFEPIGAIGATPAEIAAQLPSELATEAVPSATQPPGATPAPTATAGPTTTPRPTWTPRPTKAVLTAQEFGADWPFTVRSIEIWCTERREVVFRAAGTIYALNGTAKGAAKKNGWEDDLRPIWRDDPAVAGLKVNLSPILDRGLALCP
jgi:hypothetical protein